MSAGLVAPKITVHRVRVPFSPTSRYFSIRWDVYLGGEPFAHIYSTGATFGSWHCQILDPAVWSGDFYGKAEARAWALEMARRKIDPSRGPIVSTKNQYGGEQAIKEGGEDAAD